MGIEKKAWSLSPVTWCPLTHWSCSVSPSYRLLSSQGTSSGGLGWCPPANLLGISSAEKDPSGHQGVPDLHCHEGRMADGTWDALGEHS